MKLKKYKQPCLPLPMTLSRKTILCFVADSPLSHERIYPKKPSPQNYIDFMKQDRIIYAKLRRSISPSNEFLRYTRLLTLLFKLERRTYKSNFVYPGWVFSKNNEPARPATTSRPTANQLIFLLSLEPKQVHKYLILDTVRLYHPDILLSI